MTTARPSLEDQIAEVGREARRVANNHPAPRLTEPVRARKEANLKQAETTLTFVRDHAAGLRTLMAYLIRADGELPGRTETEIMREQSTVAALLAAFPGSVLSVSQPAAPSADHTESTPDQEND